MNVPPLPTLAKAMFPERVPLYWELALMAKVACVPAVLTMAPPRAFVRESESLA